MANVATKRAFIGMDLSEDNQTITCILAERDKEVRTVVDSLQSNESDDVIDFIQKSMVKYNAHLIIAKESFGSLPIKIQNFIMNKYIS